MATVLRPPLVSPSQRKRRIAPVDLPARARWLLDAAAPATLPPGLQLFASAPRSLWQVAGQQLLQGFIVDAGPAPAVRQLFDSAPARGQASRVEQYANLLTTTLTVTSPLTLPLTAGKVDRSAPIAKRPGIVDAYPSLFDSTLADLAQYRLPLLAVRWDASAPWIRVRPQVDQYSRLVTLDPVPQFLRLDSVEQRKYHVRHELPQNTLTLSVTFVAVPDVVGQSQASGVATLEGEGFAVALESAYSDIVPVGDIISQAPIAGSEVPAGSTVTITVSLGEAPPPVQDESFSGGLIWAYERERARRRRERQRRRELEEESERIEEETTREIARLMREQEAKDARRAELQRLSRLVDAYARRNAETELNERVQKAIEKAATKQTVWALYALERELHRAAEEEDFLLKALQAFIEYEH